MTDEETDIAALIAKSTEIDTYDFAHESDEDDYVSMGHCQVVCGS